jgi:hypothetical protein
MSETLVQYAFSAGELAPKLYGRTDFEKYDLGVAQGRNWFVDYRGGLSTRPGTEFIDYIKDPAENVAVFPFQFSPDTSNTYGVIVGKDWIRFTQDGAYVLETEKVITAITLASPGVVTSAVHGFDNGDWIKFNCPLMPDLHNRTCVVTNKTANTFELYDVYGTLIDTSGYPVFSSGSVQRIYTIASPYAVADLPKLRGFQIRDYIRITHNSYPVKNLQRLAHTNWTISDEAIGNNNTRPSGLTHSISSAGSAGALFCVTAIYNDGTQSLPSAPYFATSLVNYAATSGQLTLRWTPVVGAQYYRVFRSVLLADAAGLSAGMEMGYLGRADGAQFIDNNIVPDFTSEPPLQYNPFAPGAIDSIDVTTVGTGYTNASVVTVTTSTGSGFVGFAMVNTTGGLTGINILNGGTGYVAGDTINVSIGSGAVITKTLSPASGSYPAVSTILQQRQLYAATGNDPLAVIASRPGLFDNFDVERITNASDSFSFSLDADTVAPIRDIIAMRGGSLICSATGIWQLSGGDSPTISATKAYAEPQSYIGVADIRPIRVDTQLIYVTDKESIVRLLNYDFYSKAYAGKNMSILSSHLFDINNPIVDWTYQEAPNRLVICALKDGTGLFFALEVEQNVYAWTPFSTQGKIKNVFTLQEDRADVTYMVVERYINGKVAKFIEKLSLRDRTYIEDYIGSDANISLAANVITDRTLTLSDSTGSVTATASAPSFSPGSVGSHIRVGGGKGYITNYISGSQVTINLVRPVTEFIPETTTMKPFTSWSLDAPVTNLYGLHHLEGQTVKILADGNVQPDMVVSAGRLTLPAGATRVNVGLGYRCICKTLPIAASGAKIEANRKHPVGISIALDETRGLKYGRSLTQLYEMKTRTNELMGEPENPTTKRITLQLKDNWNATGQIYFIQDNPLPARILGFVHDMEIGDDSR